MPTSSYIILHILFSHIYLANKSRVQIPDAILDYQNWIPILVNLWTSPNMDPKFSPRWDLIASIVSILVEVGRDETQESDNGINFFGHLPLRCSRDVTEWRCSDIRGWRVTQERISSYQAGREFPFKHLQNSQSIKVQQFWNISLIALFSSISLIEMSISHILGFFFITNL